MKMSPFAGTFDYFKFNCVNNGHRLIKSYISVIFYIPDFEGVIKSITDKVSLK